MSFTPAGRLRALLVLAIPLAVASPERAAADYVSGDGHQYEMTCTKDGYRLQSVYPVGRFVGQGAGTRTVVEREVLSLGRSCDAHTTTFGYGQWCWANGGFSAEFPGGASIGFPRQELYCPVEPEYDLRCRC